MEFVASPEWGEIWATDPADRFVSANRRSTSRPTATPHSDPWIAFNIEIDSIARTAVEAGVLRFDASDLMPPGIGGGRDGGPLERSGKACSTGSTGSAPSTRSSQTSMRNGRL